MTLTVSSDAEQTYGYIRSHMKNHVRVTSLCTLSPGDDFVEGIPCESVEGAEALARGLDTILVKTGVLDEMVQERRNTVSPFTLDVDTVGDTLPVELELDGAIDYIERDALVHITPNDKTIRPFYGVVEVTFPEENKALVRHVSGTYMNTFCIEEIKLIYSATARGLGNEMAASR